jgi:hypothetical protein
MSEAAINAVPHRMGYDTRGRDHRPWLSAMARTILHQDLGMKPEVIEHQCQEYSLGQIG